MGLYAKEVAFYRELSPEIDVRVPRLFAAECAPDGSEFILLLEDLGPAQQGDQIAGCSLDDARHAIEQAAALHASSWNADFALNHPLLQRRPDLSAQLTALYPQAHAVFLDRYAEDLTASERATCEDVARLFGAMHAREPADRCLIHGDFRLDNILFAIHGWDEPIAVLDWQTAALGSPGVDLGYFMGCGIGALGPENDDELLELYVHSMNERGVALDRASLETEYRIGILTGVATAVFSAAFVERTPRGDANFLSMARGACALAEARDAVRILEDNVC